MSITRDIYPLTTVISFEEEIARIKFDIIGITETRRKGEGCLTFNTSGHTFYYKGGDTCHRGVGFIVNKNIAGNVISFKSVSDRLAQLTIRINGKYHLNIIQAYLPTSNHDDQEVGSVYDFVDSYIERPIFLYCEMDTDSAYIALAGESIDGLVSADHREHYFRHRSKWLPANML